jgi:hypothetical protein
MAIALTATEKDNIQHAIDLMLKGTAVELPVDSTCMENVGKAARSVGFSVTGKTFEQAVRDNPVTTLLEFILFVGA